MKITLNPNKEYVEKIRKAIANNNGYCPCSLIKDDNHLCICKDATENGECHCGLYIIEKD
jgi:ferredoxin-thioredoxin reductase catalytic subunit